MSEKSAEKLKSQQQTSIGGQAVIEGVMMRGKSMYMLAVRNLDTKIISTKKCDIKPASKKLKLFKLPIFRGMSAFVESLTIGMGVITMSAEMAGLDDFEDSSSDFEKKLSNKLGPKLNDIIIGLSVVIAIVISVALFMVLPIFIASIFKNFLKGGLLLSFSEGVIRILIFLGYILLISQAKDVKRVFEYHGAEHKTINCYEGGKDLTVDNVRRFTRIHKRCGTSFLVFVMIISMLVFMFVKTTNPFARVLSRIILVPFIAGISYEVIKWAGKSKSKAVSAISYPGMCLQKITTKEPDDEQIEVAIAAMKGVLDEEQN